MIKLGSLFDGSGGFPLAGTICGMQPVWASEIEPYPLRVTAARFPHMEQLGDVTKITGALCANSHPGSYTGQDAFNGMLPVVLSDKPQRKYIVRRLTPLECCRLQGFPDWWEDGVEGSDSARYKMWGNGIALPCAVFVLNGIARAMAEQWGGDT